MRGLEEFAGTAVVRVPFLAPLEEFCRRLLVEDRSGMICFDVLRW